MGKDFRKECGGLGTFQNDAVNFLNRDDVITFLIHLGYLAYDEKKQCAYIPNEEVRQELLKATRQKKWKKFIEFERQSENLQILCICLNRSISIFIRHC